MLTLGSGGYRVGIPGGYSGWVPRRAIPGVLPSCSRRSQEPAERARKACRAWSGGFLGPGVLGTAAGTGYDPPLRGPVGPTPVGPPWSYPSRMPPPGQ